MADLPYWHAGGRLRPPYALMGAVAGSRRLVPVPGRYRRWSYRRAARLTARAYDDPKRLPCDRPRGGAAREPLVCRLMRVRRIANMSHV